MRLLVCGGRHFNNSYVLGAYLDAIKPSLIIHGCATGADQLAGLWAKNHVVPVLEFPADWAKFGKGAGPMRNRRMLEEGKPEKVLAFPGGRGTANMINQAKKAGVEVIEVSP